MKEAIDIHGYEAVDIAAVVYAKTLASRETLASQPADNPALLLALHSVSADIPLAKVLDFGGACGLHKLQARMWCDRLFDWWVVETPVMVRQAKLLETDYLHFVTNVDDVHRPDLVFASGSIQYASDPMAVLHQLLHTKASRIVLSRLPLQDGLVPIERLQRCRLSDNGPGPMPPGLTDAWVNLPVQSLPRQPLQALFALAGYAIRASWLETDGRVYLLERR